MQSFGEVHLELKSCPVLDQQHPILSLYRHFAECSLYKDLHIMKLPFNVQRCTMSSPWQWLPFTSPSGRQSLSSSYTGTIHFFLLHFCTDVHKSQAAIFIFYIYSDSSAEERKDQIYQQQPIYQGETFSR